LLETCPVVPPVIVVELFPVEFEVFVAGGNTDIVGSVELGVLVVRITVATTS
jgi:hypothetical protein